MPQPGPKTSSLIRLGVVTYVFALSLIATFSIAFHFITDSIVNRQQATARVVNISGRQRMLSQRIVELGLERVVNAGLRSDTETEGALRSSIQLMETSAKELKQGSDESGASVLGTPAVSRIYEQAPWNLDARQADFLEHAHAVADKAVSQLSAQDSDLQALEVAARAPLLDALNAVVDAVQTGSEKSIQHLRRVLAGLTLMMLVILMLEALLLYRPLFLQLGRANEELILTGRTDSMTGCLNRRGFAASAELTIEEARTEGSAVSVMMIDLDGFKSVNDMYGHAAGDQAIASVALLLSHRTRRNNIVCRMGGEEFAIILPQTALSAAMTAAENLRATIEANPVRLESEKGGTKFPVTVSIGVAELRFEDVTLFHALNRADKALYRAKMQGRNRVERERQDTDIEDALDQGFSLHSRV